MSARFDLHSILKGYDPIEILVVVGPTASGKTELAIQLAEQIQGEIVGADSVQIYREFNKGTGKPSQEEMERASHHLINFVDPLEHFDANQFVQKAENCIEDIRRRGKVPVLCGGTFLWLKALLLGLDQSPSANLEIRERHRKIAEEKGRDILHQMLQTVDPVRAEQLNTNDFVRVSRALEVFEVSGIPQSKWHEQHGFSIPKYAFRFVGVQMDKNEVDARILKRTIKWMDEGWVDEVHLLIEKGYRNSRAMNSVGYKQVVEYVEGRFDPSELVTRIVQATRIYARRQRTWLRDQNVAFI